MWVWKERGGLLLVALIAGIAMFICRTECWQSTRRVALESIDVEDYSLEVDLCRLSDGCTVDIDLSFRDR